MKKLCRVRMFRNRELRKIYGPKREKARGQEIKLQIEELYDFCSTPKIIQVMRPGKMWWAEHVAWMGEMRHFHNYLVNGTTLETMYLV
jgi:hypothetical protein